MTLVSSEDRTGATVQRRAPRKGRVRRTGVGTAVWLTRIGIVVVLLVGWQISGMTSQARRIVFSTPGDVLYALYDGFVNQDWLLALAVTAQEAVLGLLLGVAAAVVVVAVIVPLPWLARFISPFVGAANALPIVVLAPMFIVWFGISLQSKVYFVAVAIFFIVFYGLYAGIRSIDRALIDNARVLGARPLALVRQVYVPAVLTWVVASLRLSCAWSLLAAVVAEYLGSNQGMGFEIASAQQQLRTDAVVAGLVVVATIAVVIDRGLVRFEAHVSKWRLF